jgi:transaldolase
MPDGAGNGILRSPRLIHARQRAEERDGMKFFIDTADLDEIRDLAATGLLDGVTTNPSLIAKSGRDMLEVIKEICDVVPGDVSAEVTATDYHNMVREGQKLAKLADNVVIKVPLTMDGLKACRTLSNEGTKVNVTLCFSAAQALLAAKAGATYISPFVGRLDDISTPGMQLIEDIVDIYLNYPDIETEVLVASIRHPLHLVDAAKMGAHVATIPPSVLRQLFQHPLTDKGLAAFLADWEKTGQSIMETGDSGAASESTG